MHIQHIDSTSGHTGNISGPPLPQSKVAIGTLMWTLIHLKDTYFGLASLQNSRPTLNKYSVNK